MESPIIRQLIKDKKISEKELAGKNEKYIISLLEHPQKGIARALVIAGSDKRGTIYGIYELSRQMGVSPWYWWQMFRQYIEKMYISVPEVILTGNLK